MQTESKKGECFSFNSQYFVVIFNASLLREKGVKSSLESWNQIKFFFLLSFILILMMTGASRVECCWQGCVSSTSSEIGANLLQHLSNDHIGWKRDTYECLWEGCKRQEVQWKNRFSFINHVRLHSGESPCECQYCYKTFSNMEGLEKHVNTEHEGIEKRVPASIKKKRKLFELQQKYGDLLSEDSDDDLPMLPLVLDDIKTTANSTTSKLLVNNKKLVKKDPSAPLSIKDQYKLAKAQLNYILRENEMLCDEWANTEKKLKRLRTERRVLLDALIKRDRKSVV